MTARELQIQVVDTAITPDSEGNETISFRSREGSDFFRVRLYLDGPQLSYVRAVTYRLHPTFPESIRRIERSAANPNCELVIWTWGVFDVAVTVEDVGGRLYDLKHELTFGNELRKEGVRYLEADVADVAQPRLRFSSISSVPSGSHA